MIKIAAVGDIMPGGILSGLNTGYVTQEVLEALQDNFNGRIVRLGIPDHFVKHGPVPRLISDCGYDADAIKRAVIKVNG